MKAEANMATMVSNLGYAHSMRFVGDPTVNRERAISLFKRAINMTSPEEDGDAWALSHTNLGLCLLDRAAEARRHVADHEPPPESADDDVTEAVSHFQEALRFRSPERDPRDWAYTQANLGIAHSRNRYGDPHENLKLALACYEAAEWAYAQSDDTLAHAQALHNLSSVKFSLAHHEPENRDALLAASIHHARQSLALRPIASDPLHASRTWLRLAHSLWTDGDLPAAVEACKQAVDGASLAGAPRDIRDAAHQLAQLHLELGLEGEAAEAFEVMAVAAAEAWETRSTSYGRAGELHENLNLFRWAAYWLTIAGRPERAIEILELGRARELAERLQIRSIDLGALARLNPGLATRYADVSARSELLSIALNDVLAMGANDPPAVAAELAALRAEIAALPGFERAFSPIRFAEIVGGLEPREALVYLITAPDGCVALAVSNRPKTAAVKVTTADVTSTQLVRQLLGDTADRGGPIGGYFAAHHEMSAGLAQIFAELGEVLGPSLLRPVSAELAAQGVEQVSIVAVRLLGLLPLQALPWDQAQTCMLDHFDCIVAPSAAVRAMCRARVPLASEGHALIVGNPLPQTVPLDGAEQEARAVAAEVTISDVRLLVGKDADKDSVVAQMPGAHLVHLACHASASILDQSITAALVLAEDAPLRPEEIASIPDFQPRLVVASACESGVVQGYATADKCLASDPPSSPREHAG